MTTRSGGTQERTPLGELLEEARVNVLHLTGREAARRAGISEARWRQVVTGWQPRDGARAPATPKVRTVIAMAQAVNVDVRTALAAANIPITDEALAGLLEERLREPQPGIGTLPPPGSIDLKYEVDRISRLNVPAQTKFDLTRQIIDLYEQVEAEARE